MKSIRKTYKLKTLGCKANLYDSQILERKLQTLGYRSSSSEDFADLCLVNSCSVTNEADRQSQKVAERFFRENPSSTVILTGCSAEANPDRFRSNPSIHYIVGNRDKKNLLELLEKKNKKPRPLKPEILGSSVGYTEMRSRHPVDREWPLPEEVFFTPVELKNEDNQTSSSARTRVFLKIQEGCNSFCTFCIIPYARGPSRSLGLAKVLDQIQFLTTQGVKEIVLTGTNLGDYGIEWSEKGKAFDQLIESILLKTNLKRLRLSSLDPTEITPRIREMMQSETRLCPHFHVSLQSPHSKILKLMKRHYQYSDLERSLNQLARLNPIHGPVFIGMDLITGFPGETDEIYRETLAMLDGLPWTRIHVFPYSERAKTPATRLSNRVDPSTRKSRAREIMKRSKDRLEIFLHTQKKQKQISDVLFESKVRGPDGKSDWWSGYSPNYTRILVKPSAMAMNRDISNQILSVKPLSVNIDAQAGDGALLSGVSEKN